MRFTRADQVASWRLCIGCGACKYICPEKNITLKDIVHDGIRPTLGKSSCHNCSKCVDVCPGVGTEHAGQMGSESLHDLAQGWGPILEVLEGYAANPDIRFQGSSGGVASALALYCIEKAGMRGVIHTGISDDNPLCNKTVFSRNRAEICSRTGSRYSPASPCDSLDKIENADGECVFIGKPCDIAGMRKAQMLRPELDRKVGIAIGIFCAGTPATQGTIDLLNKVDVNRDAVEEIRYRGKGWPGRFSVKLKGGGGPVKSMTYMEAWGFIQRYRPYRCYLCPDGTGEFADISCGDAWHREIKDDEKGYSLALVRTKKGREILRGAVDAGYVMLKKADLNILEASQRNLLMKRGAIWGRVAAMKLCMVPAPRLKGFFLFENWLRIPFRQEMRSFLGTFKRIIERKYYKPKRKTFAENDF